MSAKKEAKLPERGMLGVEEGKGEADLCKNLFALAKGAWGCQRMTTQYLKVEVFFFGCKNEVVVLVAQRLER